MVLPEGVLNTSHLQKVREYFEGRAKIILICSIPQDVFIAAGATVKPSLVFFRRFTEIEENEYNEIVNRAQNEVRTSYADELMSLREEYNDLSNMNADKPRQREISKRLSIIEKSIIEEAKPLIKQYFDYEIPIAMVDDAGITSTGSISFGNQLPKLQVEYHEYRKSNNLWETNHAPITYTVTVSGSVYRNSNGKEAQLSW